MRTFRTGVEMSLDAARKVRAPRGLAPDAGRGLPHNSSGGGDVGDAAQAGEITLLEYRGSAGHIYVELYDK